MTIDHLSEDQVAATRARRISFMGLLEIESNPLTDEDVAMFEMFERERWPHERCRQYILDHVGDRSQTVAE
ncbi:hypothetical protein [Sphingomonas sp. CARO-RG-8B-R24-01]|uniref:hypothetical protein n=1 Tax=Sphingomonas sp. CARO-RG-8B-R24-01 TaxID=2914831 RepID=UPI001F5AE73E|nr:hypothetical protein [Sphingomonas sp. CARO-RG-8B-R24-01]